MSHEHEPEEPPKRSATTGRPASVTEPESGTRLSAVEIHDNVLGSAESELKRPAVSLFTSAVAAGLTIGFSFIAGAFVRHLTPDHLDRIAAAAVYPLGFIFVVRARNELFTENTLEPVIPLLHERDARTFRRMMRLWGLLIAGNLLGTLILSMVMAWTPALPETLRGEMLRMAAEETSHSFGLTLYHAVFAGWLLALLTWMLASTTSGTAQILLVWLATAPIAAFEFKHSIVGSAEAFYRAAMGNAGWLDMLGRFVTPSLIGNAIGGVVIVALLNFGQVRSERG
jgi:formate/nitrite transporter FocA (FNT family)